MSWYPRLAAWPQSGCPVLLIDLSSDLPRRQTQSQNHCVAQVAHFRRHSERLSGCSAVPYQNCGLVRNEEAEGSNPFSSTKLLNNLHRFFELLELTTLPKFSRFRATRIQDQSFPPASGGSPGPKPILRTVR
jgi:hypothetical protein